jgi:pimeloyl-ACP methyl ester carboxylesterase
MPHSPPLLRVRSGDVSIAVREHSAAGPGRATVVLVHGYPDQQDTWDALIARLPLDAWHVVTYDVRGAGSSDAPASRDGYLLERLVDDLVAVLGAVLADGERVHLVGHDWGSAQLWDAVATESTDPRLTGRIASFTSISAPSLDHAGWLMRHPGGRRLALLRQAQHSWYIGLFCLPVLPSLLWRHGDRVLALAGERREGLPRGHWGPELRRNAVNGLELYRANVLARSGRRRRLHTSVPVLVIQPERDRYVTDVFLQGLDAACDDLRVERLDGGHWVIVNQPEAVAPLVVRHVAAHCGEHTS